MSSRWKASGVEGGGGGFSSVGSVHHALRRPSWNTAHRGRTSVDRVFIIVRVRARRGASLHGGAGVVISVVHEGNRQPGISDKSETVCHHPRTARWGGESMSPTRINGSTACGDGRTGEGRWRSVGVGGTPRGPPCASGSSQRRGSNYPTWSIVIAPAGGRRGRGSGGEGTGAAASASTKGCHQAQDARPLDTGRRRGS